LGKLEFADARLMLGMGLDVAVATDFNPGSSMVDSLLVVSSLACSFMKMTPAEVLLGMTIKAAKAVSREDAIGSIRAGKQADLVLFSIPDFRYIPYHFGGDMVRAVIKKGRVVFDRDAQEAS
jgi:imidazolonepropionase